MTCGSKCTCKKEEWNNGTIYRIFVQRTPNATSNIIDVPVDIAQSDLTGKVFIGVENYCLDRRLCIQLVDNNNSPWDLTEYPIYNLQFTVVIYKPRNTYN